MLRVLAAISTYRHCRGMGWVLVRGRCLKAASRICSPRSRCGTRAQARHLPAKRPPLRNPSCHFIVPLFNYLYSALLQLFVISPPFTKFPFFSSCHFHHSSCHFSVHRATFAPSHATRLSYSARQNFLARSSRTALSLDSASCCDSPRASIPTLSEPHTRQQLYIYALLYRENASINHFAVFNNNPLH